MDHLALDVAVVLGIFGLAISLICYKIVSRYLILENLKTTSDQKAAYESKILDLGNKYQSMENSRDGYRQKLNYIKTHADIFFDDDELIDDASIEQEELIPAIAKALFPKMPKKFTELLGREDIQDAIFKVAEKNPDKIGEWVGKFFSKKDEPESKTTVLKENYI